MSEQVEAPNGLAPWQERLAARAPSLAGRSVRQLVVAAVSALAAAGVVVAAALWLLRAPPPPVELSLPRATTSVPTSPSASGGGSGAAAATPPTTAAEVVVQVAGGVVRPGVYRLPAGSRVHELLAAAGGPIDGAEPERLALAAPLVDGQRVQVPLAGEALDPGAPVGPSPGAAGGGGVGGPASPPGPVDLNVATAEQLDELPGVGPATAAAIVEHRRTQGPFTSVDGLLDVPGIGPAKLAALRELVRV